MKINTDKMSRERIQNCHNGTGGVIFREIFSEIDFESSLEHFHETIIEPHATIGYHQHTGNEEVYYIVEGRGKMTLNGNEVEVEPGDAIITQSGDSHGLSNTSDSEMRILVFQCKY